MDEFKNLKVAIASGKGGTGKTIFSTNFFYALRELKQEVTLVDCDAEEPNDLLFFETNELDTFDVIQNIPVIDPTKCIYCSKCHDICNYHAILSLPKFKLIQVIDELCHSCGACLYACEDNAIHEKESVIGQIKTVQFMDLLTIVEAKSAVGLYSPVPVIKSALKVAGNEGVIIYDAPPGCSCSFIQTVVPADFVILVTEPSLFGLSDLKQTVDTLRQLKKNCGVIINRMRDDYIIHQYLEEESIPLLLEIPFQKEIAESYSKGDLFIKRYPEWETKFLKIFSEINKKYGNSSH